jgi:hypothetical protein
VNFGDIRQNLAGEFSITRLFGDLSMIFWHEETKKICTKRIMVRKIMNAKLKAVHKFSSNHRAAIMTGRTAGCFHCEKTFLPRETGVKEWIDWTDTGKTALCPFCGIDSVISSADVPEITDPEFLRRMRKHWFEDEEVPAPVRPSR